METNPMASIEERNKHLRERLCFICHKTGHVSRNCRNNRNNNHTSTTSTFQGNPNRTAYQTHKKRPDHIPRNARRRTQEILERNQEDEFTKEQTEQPTPDTAIPSLYIRVKQIADRSMKICYYMCCKRNKETRALKNQRSV
jgi:hypothetical protein